MEQSSKLGILFGGGAGFFSYYIGIAKFIFENYNLDDVIFAGVSAGSIAALSLSISDNKTGYFLDKVILEGSNTMRKSNSSQGFFFKDGVIGPEGIKVLKKNLTRAIQESKKFENVNKKCTIIATRLEGINPITEYINHWDSINELVECISASCWVPLVFGDLSTKFRGMNYIDGGFPFLFQSGRMENSNYDFINIDLHTFNRFQDNPLQSAMNLGALFFSANDAFTNHMIDLGYKDAKSHPEVFYKLRRKQFN